MSDIEKTLYEEYHVILKQEGIQLSNLKNEWKSKLKGLINCTGLWNYLNESLDYWRPIGLTSVKLTEEKSFGYSSYQHAREVGGSPLYLQQDCDIKGINHNYVLQTTGYLGDDYSGFLLFPTKNGQYFKIEYSC